MRKEFFDKLHELMEKDRDVVFITGDLGYGLADRIRDDFPDRFINTGAAEQTMMGVAVGLALSGKKPFVYSITPFLLWRAAEWIRNYINHESIPVVMVGSGRGRDYAHDGFSHDATDDVVLMSRMYNVARYVTIPDLATIRKPAYLNLSR